ncbi:hypothetical protein [Pareuzebyella sediminis]|uniref:hypothetical protein n=1 Tax=Pareuzebyella sediminis TaxID=2607998 RepID=UPI0011EE9E7D|nr:hypothetical protein [Pareuzebyella sediminis]
MHRLLPYLKFLMASSNQHGVHSPFIYNYITKCIYRSTPSASRHAKSIQVLLKSIDYFNVKKLRLPAEEEKLKLLIESRFPYIEFEGDTYDILYFTKSELRKLPSILSKGDCVHNQSLLLLDGIHYNKRSEEAWKRILTDKKARVTVDMFYCGAIFFRNEQAEEHFKIRI